MRSKKLVNKKIKNYRKRSSKNKKNSKKNLRVKKRLVSKKKVGGQWWQRQRERMTKYVKNNPQTLIKRRDLLRKYAQNNNKQKFDLLDVLTEKGINLENGNIINQGGIIQQGVSNFFNDSYKYLNLNIENELSLTKTKTDYELPSQIVKLINMPENININIHIFIPKEKQLQTTKDRSLFQMNSYSKEKFNLYIFYIITDKNKNKKIYFSKKEIDSDLLQMDLARVMSEIINSTDLYFVRHLILLKNKKSTSLSRSKHSKFNICYCNVEDILKLQRLGIHDKGRNYNFEKKLMSESLSFITKNDYFNELNSSLGDKGSYNETELIDRHELTDSLKGKLIIYSLPRNLKFTLDDITDADKKYLHISKVSVMESDYNNKYYGTTWFFYNICKQAGVKGDKIRQIDDPDWEKPNPN